MIFFLKAFSLLPMGFLFQVSNLLAWIARDVFKYRREVVVQNLTNAFPEKSASEIMAIARKFYSHLADVVVESIKAVRISPQELERRVYFRNPELLSDYGKKYQTALVLTVHLGNWEWASLRGSVIFDFVIHPMYLPLTNKGMDHLLLETRGRFGAEPLSSFRALIKSLKTANDYRVGAILADQTPPAHADKHWAKFLNQETAFLPGIEKVPRYMNCPVLFMWSRRIRRGHYEVIFEPIEEPPYGDSKDSIMSSYIERAQKAINQYPEQWLWSHQRWKYTRTPED